MTQILVLIIYVTVKICITFTIAHRFIIVSMIALSHFASLEYPQGAELYRKTRGVHHQSRAIDNHNVGNDGTSSKRRSKEMN